jgi:proteasome lid subunit RPN8/RPN11
MYYIKTFDLRLLISETENKSPVEACGLLLTNTLNKKEFLQILPTNGKFNTVTSFRIEQKCIEKIKLKISDTNLKICGCFHSHTFGSARPSKMDINCKKNEGDIWLIYSKAFTDVRIYKWVSNTFHRQRFKVIK